MTNEELKAYANRTMIANIVLYNANRPRLDRPEESYPPQWEIWAYGYGTTPYEEMMGSIDGVLKNSSRSQENKIYTSLDRAYTAIRKLGYRGMIHIDG